MHTDNHVFYVYLGINDTIVKQICKITDTNTVTALIICFIFENNLFMPDSFKPDVVGHIVSIVCENFIHFMCNVQTGWKQKGKIGLIVIYFCFQLNISSEKLLLACHICE